MLFFTTCPSCCHTRLLFCWIRWTMPILYRLECTILGWINTFYFFSHNVDSNVQFNLGFHDISCYRIGNPTCSGTPDQTDQSVRDRAVPNTCCGGFFNLGYYNATVQGECLPCSKLAVLMTQYLSYMLYKILSHMRSCKLAIYKLQIILSLSYFDLFSQKCSYHYDLIFNTIPTFY